MAQSEVYDWLLQQRQLGNDTYFTIKEIASGLKSLGVEGDVERKSRRAIPGLLRCGILEHRINMNIMDWKRTYRISNNHMIKYDKK